MLNIALFCSNSAKRSLLIAFITFTGICTICRNVMPREDDFTESKLKIATRGRKLRVRFSVLDESGPSQDTSYTGLPDCQHLPTSEKEDTTEINPADHFQEINALLRTRDYSPIRYSLRTKWSDASTRTSCLESIRSGTWKSAQMECSRQRRKLPSPIIIRISRGRLQCRQIIQIQDCRRRR